MVEYRVEMMKGVLDGVVSPGAGTARPVSRFHGVALMLVAALGFAVMGIILRGERAIAGPHTAMLWRGVLGLVCILPVALVTGQRLWGGRPGLLALRGFAGAVALLFYFLSIVRVDLGTATALCYLNPIVAAILASRYLGERISVVGWTAIASAWGGVVLMVWPSNDSWATWGGFYGLLSGIFSGVAVFTLRALRREGDPTIPILAIFFAISAVVALPGAWLESPSLGLTSPTWRPLTGIALAATAAQAGLTLAYRHLPTRLGGPVALFVLPLAMGGAWMLYGETPSPRAVAGGVLLFASVVVLARQGEGPGGSEVEPAFVRSVARRAGR